MPCLGELSIPFDMESPTTEQTLRFVFQAIVNLLCCEVLLSLPASPPLFVPRHRPVAFRHSEATTHGGCHDNNFEDSVQPTPYHLSSSVDRSISSTMESKRQFSATAYSCLQSSPCAALPAQFFPGLNTPLRKKGPYHLRSEALLRGRRVRESLAPHCA